MENMTFETFDRIARTDKVTVTMAMELLLQGGRNVVIDSSESDLAAAMKASTSNFFFEQKLQEIISMAKSLAQLDTGDLLAYIKRSGLDVSNPGEQAEGICPICGGSVEYGEEIPMDDGGVYKWACPNCGASGQEGYSKVFDWHYNMMDREGNPYSAPRKD